MTSSDQQRLIRLTNEVEELQSIVENLLDEVEYYDDGNAFIGYVSNSLLERMQQAGNSEVDSDSTGE